MIIMISSMATAIVIHTHGLHVTPQSAHPFFRFVPPLVPFPEEVLIRFPSFSSNTAPSAVSALPFSTSPVPSYSCRPPPHAAAGAATIIGTGSCGTAI
ncbi:hypothetical protein DFH27DRAFT_543091 [Peziza echinospora]|nr:hypothetical protein DFH27DRAFT_543091 [Peziza echinospora]